MTPTLDIQQQLVSKGKMRIVKNRMIFCTNATLQPGEFNGDGDRLDVAVGMPRGANLTGKVVLNDSSASFTCWVL